MAIPLTLVAARLHVRWVLLALLLAAAYYYIMYKLSGDTTLQTASVRVFGSVGKVMLCLLAAWLVLLAGWLARKSVLSFPQTADAPLTALLLLALAAWTARNGIRCVVRCGCILLVLLGVLYGVVLVFSAPKVELRQLAPVGTPSQSLLFLPLLTVPTLTRCYQPAEATGKRSPWLIAGGMLALAASVITAGCLSPQLAEEEMSFYALSRSVSLFGTMERFEALISAACETSYFCAVSFLLCTVRELLLPLFPKLPEKKLRLFPFAAAAALLSNGLRVSFFAVGASVFCGIFPLVTQGIEREKNL